ncbi:uncharacterized protein [Rutidosis leptorrhynchoides]|uniref:uncharacterized protein n=1 Tax=Rutidosis leptorrhynchoides TaxID=125765 RepID=UPI003A99F25B
MVSCMISLLVWRNSIRPRSQPVSWFHIVWFTQCVPRHAFVVWLVLREKLKTQDKLQTWEVNDTQILLCSLCNSCPDSHNHLFFDCPFSNEVWRKAQQVIKLPFWSFNWKDFPGIISPIASLNSANAKLMYAATIYYIWQERNRRLFKGLKRSPARLYDDIVSTVRIKLLSVRFKESRQVKELKIAWQLP